MLHKTLVIFTILLFCSTLSFAQNTQEDLLSLDSEDTTSQVEIQQIEALEPLEEQPPLESQDNQRESFVSDDDNTTSQGEIQQIEAPEPLEKQGQPESLDIRDKELQLLIGDHVSEQEGEGKEDQNEDHSYHFVIGQGFLFHLFSKFDDFRKEKEIKATSSKQQEITLIGGSEFFVEYFPGDMTQVSNLSFGANYQSLTGGYTNTSLRGNLERNVDMINLLLYTSWSAGIGESKYWRLGGTLGYGSSTYTYLEKWDRTSSFWSDTPDYKIEETTTGRVTKLGFFADWGRGFAGGRIGYTFISTSYELMDGSMPNGSGEQLFGNFRLAF